MLIATVETLFLAYSVISASFVSLPWYIAFDIFVGDKKTLSCLNFVSSLLLLNGMSEREYVVILFLTRKQVEKVIAERQSAFAAFNFDKASIFVG